MSCLRNACCRCISWSIKFLNPKSIIGAVASVLIWYSEIKGNAPAHSMLAYESKINLVCFTLKWWILFVFCFDNVLYYLFPFADLGHNPT